MEAHPPKPPSPVTPNTILNAHYHHNEGICSRHQAKEMLSDIQPLQGLTTGELLHPSTNCSQENIAALSTSELLNFLDQTDESCLSILFTKTSYSGGIFSELNLIAVADRIDSRASAFSGANDQSLYELIYFTRIGQYLKSYYPSEITFNQATVNIENQEAYQNVIENSALSTLGNETVSKLLYQLTVSIDTASLGVEFLPFLKTVLVRSRDNPSVLSNYYEQLGLYSVFYLFQRVSVHTGLGAVIDADTISLLGHHAKVTSHTGTSLEYLTSNAIWALAQILYRSDEISLSGSNEQLVKEQLTLTYHTHPTTTELYLRTVTALTSLLGVECNTLTDSTQICRTPIVNALKEQIFTNSYTFDDGSIVVKTPLPISVIQPLYQASKEIEGHFFRLLGNDEAVPTDPEDPLTMYIYGSRGEYEKYHSFLFNLGTSNGGIYIEQDTTFYTYQRTPSESIYTLEELFRHEYVHYLVGKYLVDGMWGSAPIYGADRMVWVDEGLAEFLAGSLRHQGIKNRYSIVSQLYSDAPASKMNPSQIVAATYSSGFTFYRYAGTLFHYLYNHQMGRLQNLLGAILSGDLSGFDSEIASLAGDSAIASGYSTHINSVISDIYNSLQPLTTVPEQTSFETYDVSIIQHFLRQVAPFSNTTCSDRYLAVNRRFECQGTLTTGTSNLLQARNSLEVTLNSAIWNATKSPLNNLHHIVCYYKNLQSGSGQSTADYICSGPIHPDATLLTADFDLDGISNQSDLDDDNDGLSDTDEIKVGRNTLGPLPTDAKTASKNFISQILTVLQKSKDLMTSAEKDPTELISAMAVLTEIYQVNKDVLKVKGKPSKFAKLIKKIEGLVNKASDNPSSKTLKLVIKSSNTAKKRIKK